MDAHIQAAVEIGMEILIVTGLDVQNFHILGGFYDTFKHLRVEQIALAASLVHIHMVTEPGEANLFQSGTVIVTMAAVVVVRLQPDLLFQLQESSLGGAVMHLAVDPAAGLAHPFGHMGGFFGQCAFPVLPAATQAIFPGKVNKRDALSGRGKEMGPEFSDFRFAVVFL